MSVRESLLAILDQGPCYGYQLRAEFDRRTGSISPLNVGQVYNTLDRLEREGLVTKADVDDEGHVYWEITDAGRTATSAWLSAPLDHAQPARDDLAVKIALAATLPGVDVVAVIETQRQESLRRLESLRHAKHSGAHPGGPEELARALVVDSAMFATEAQLRWLDHTEQQLALHPRHALELTTDRPKRGRPARIAASVP